jgi:hypothetical protein
MILSLNGPHEYRLSIETGGIKYCHHPDSKRTKFVSPVTTRSPKLYIVSVDGEPIYVGQTVQSITARLRMGFTADGSTGYHGYAWRHKHTLVALDLWILQGAEEENEILDIETIEAELVYLIRHHLGQWPAWQTEIHFHPSTPEHRRLAGEIYGHYRPEIKNV